MSALRDSTYAHVHTSEAVTIDGEALRDSTSTDLKSSRTVTRLTCSRCCREIGDELVYRPHYTYCEQCFPIEKARSQGTIHWPRYKWMAPPITCLVCGRRAILPMAYNGEMRSRVQTCSSTCDSKLRRSRELSDVSCSGCGERFRQSRKDQRYCSSACKQKAYRGRQS